ncbi:MAG TPA: hypothetical protein PKI62_01285 [bacterium]|nr:hypothetical protein [bacterium]HPR86749.1 hypothetical protein [bacterium]
MFQSLKAAAAKKFINPYLEGIGVIQELEFNKEARSILALVTLTGEAEPVRVEAHGYLLGPDSITISKFICSRPWLETTLNRFLANRKFTLPEQARSAIRMVL